MKKKNQHIHFVAHGHHSFGSAFGVTPSEGLKSFVKASIRQEIRPMGKGHLPWSDFMVRGVDRPLPIANGGEESVREIIVVPRSHSAHACSISKIKYHNFLANL